jgi:NADH-quinone oxidoreductase subunit L
MDSKLKAQVSGLFGTCILGTITILSYFTAFQYFTTQKIDGVYQKLIPMHMEWVRFTEYLHIDLGILLDPISVMMLVVITTVSLMVHVYSLSYMHGEKGFQRYYAFLSLFTFSMLGLVVATNIFQMYVFHPSCLLGSTTPNLQQLQHQRKRLLLLDLPTYSSLLES